MRIRQIKAMSLAALLTASILTPAVSDAADYPVLRGSQTEDVPPSPSEVFGARAINWNGFYLGGGAGMSRTKFNPDPSAINKQALDLSRDISATYGYQLPSSPSVRLTNESGASYFGFIGYNAAFDDAVVGIEIDYTRLNQGYHGLGSVLSASPIAPVVGPNIPGLLNATQRVDDYASIRLRGGYAIGNFLPFASIGLAAGRGTSAAVFAPVIPTLPLFSPVVAQSKNTTMYGLTAGVGIDAALGENVILRAEYLFTRFANFEGTVVDINNVRVGVGLKF